jgi:hypothetical protein
MNTRQREHILAAEHRPLDDLLPDAQTCPSCGHWRWPCDPCAGCREQRQHRGVKATEAALIIIWLAAAVVWFSMGTPGLP